VIDVLRASTTIVAALDHGAAWVAPRAALEEARRLAAATGALLGGERGGLRQEGFDLGNSPLEYTRERLGGRPVVITTTNGTAALAACAVAREVLVGALVNRRAVAAFARDLAGPDGAVHLVCAGTDGVVTEEDRLAAGAILDAAVAAADVCDAAACAARDDFRRLDGGDVASRLVAALRRSRGGRNLLALGMDADVEACARLDVSDVVPRLDRATGRLVSARPF